MAELKSANSARPSSLGKPVPGAEEQASADAFLGSFDPPPAAPSAPPQNADEFLNQVDASATVPPPEDQFAPEPGFIRANIDQADPQNLLDRIQTGLASNDTEKVSFLQKKYGNENVAIKNDKIYFRRDKSEKLKRLDPDTLELISDIIPDFLREGITEATMLPGEIAGTMGGAAAGMAAGGLPGIVPGMTLGATAGRVASVPLANAVADKAAEAVGVPQDASRSKGLENAIGMGMEAVLPFVGKYVGKTIAKRIPGTAAYKAAREAGEKEIVALSKQSQEVVQAAADLEKEGLKVGLTLNQVQPDSPKIQQMVKGVEESGQFLNKQREFAEGYGESLRKTVEEIAKRGDSKGVSPEKLASSVTNAVESLDAAEGKAIQNYRRKSLAATGNQKVPLPQNVTNEVTQLMTELGFQRKTKKLDVITRPTFDKLGGKKQIERQVFVPPANLQPYIGRLGLDDTQTRAVVNVLNEYGQLISRGGEARLTDVERLIKRMGPLNRRLQGSALGGKWGAMTGELRQHRRALIESGLKDDMEKKLFNSAMDDFSMIRTNTDQLSNVLRGDVTAKTIVNSFFKGKENLANIRALKKITGNDSAQWGALKEEFVNGLLMKHSSDGPTGFNSGAFLKDLQQNYGDDFIREVLNDGKPGPNYDTVKNLLTVGKRIEQVQRGVKADNASQEIKDGIANTAIGLIAGIKFKAVNGIASLIGAGGTKESTLMEIFNRDGFEKYLAGYKGKDKGRIAQNIEAMLSQYNAARAGSKKVKALTDIGKEVGKRGTRAYLREGAEH